MKKQKGGVEIKEPKVVVKQIKESSVSKSSAKGKKIYLNIDHPKNEEVITHKVHYAIRVSATPNGIVEVSIDSGEWRKCRFSVGHWWYDWHNIPVGVHTIVARLYDEHKKRTIKKSEPVRVIVK